MERKPLEGIESLLFALGAGAGYVLNGQDYSWWVVLFIIVAGSVLMGKSVIYLKKMNKNLLGKA